MTSLLNDKRFWLSATERAVLTTAQTFAAELAVFSAVEVREKGLDGLPWYAMISVAVVAGILSFLSSIGKGSTGSAGYKVDLEEDHLADGPLRVEAPEQDDPMLEPVEEKAPELDREPLPEEVRTEETKKPSGKSGKGGSKKDK